MGILDDAKNALGGLTGAADQAVDAVGADKIKSGIHEVDDATGGASNVVTEKVDEAANSAIDKFSGN